MDSLKVLMSVIIIYGLIGVGMNTLGASIREEPDFARVAPDANYSEVYSEHQVESYLAAINDSARKMGINRFKIGEYDLSDRINVRHVWHSTQKLDTRKVKIKNEDMVDAIFDPDAWKNVGEGIFNFVTRKDAYQQWKDNHRTNISYNNPVFIYPHFRVKLTNKDEENELITGVDLERFVAVRAWDARGNNWLSDAWKWSPWIGGTADIVSRLNAGDMPKRDLYYAIDFIIADTDVSRLLTDPASNLQQLQDRGKAEVVERYGGVIYGDEEAPRPTSMQDHVLRARSTGGFSKLIDVIGNVGIAWSSFQGYGIISLLIDVMIATPLAVALLFIGYREALRMIPFVGQGGG